MNTEHKGLPVVGYQPQTEDAVAFVNENKALEERLLRRLDRMAAKGPPAYDMRWLAIARTSIEQGFMAMNRAVFQPSRIQLPGDDVTKG